MVAFVDGMRSAYGEMASLDVPPKVPSLAALLAARREAIVARFVDSVRKLDVSAGASRPALIDHIPGFLDEIIEALQAKAPPTLQVPGGIRATAREHGVQREALGYDLESLIREYGILQRAILEDARQAELPLTVDEFELLATRMSMGASEAAAAYAKRHQAELEEQRADLEFLAEAGQLLTSSLDYPSTLSRLTGLLVPRMADWCAVHLDNQSAEDMHIAHVNPAKVETLRSIYRDYPLAMHDRGFRRVMRTGSPALVRDVAPGSWDPVVDDPQQLARLREIGSCSWIIVPLRVQDTVFGALTLAYAESGRHYDESDLRLATETASRAAVAVDNARLYEISEKDRSRVAAATRAKDELVAMVSHELRTPLNAILGWVHLLKKGSLSEEKHAHALEVIERNAQAQSRVVADLLDISRIITGQVRVSMAQVDLANVVDLAVETVRAAAEAKRLHLDVAIDREVATLRGDGERLQQVVWNVLANAVKFTPKGGHVRVRLHRVDSTLELTVEDDGVGIAAEFLPSVFESFRQYDGSTSRAHGGLGLGLSIARHIVELHGGTIQAESRGAGLGALLRISLPVSPLVSTTPGITRITRPDPPAASAVATQSLDGVRVLVVEDETDARELLTVLFEAAGLEVRSVSGAAAARDQLQSFTPDVIVSDIGMPEEDGYSLIRSVRTFPRRELRDIPAIALTAFARAEDRTRALTEGFNLHLTKPADPAKLLREIETLARPSRTSRP
jgi:signal transduction histidine kinase/ActR/RegA family two-component response regulator